MRKDLFSIPIYHGSVADNDRLKSVVIPFINDANKAVSKSPPEGWLTNNLITSFDEPEITKKLIADDNEIGKEIHSQYVKVIHSFFDGEDYEAKLKGVWYNYYDKGEWQEAHTHVGLFNDPTHFSCVHFLAYDPHNHAPLSFLDPLVTYRSHSVILKAEKYCAKYSPPIKEGDFIMFPSWLAHEVKPMPPTPRNPRITISLNLQLLKYLERTNNV